MWKRTLCIALVFALPAGLGWGAPDDLRVRHVPAKVAPLVLDLQLSGTLWARDSVDLGFKQSGRVTEVLIDDGDRVGKGEPLARLDSVQQEQALRVAQASLAAALAARDQARQANDRAAAMLERGIGTRAARDAAAQELSEVKGAVERAESSADQARRAVEDTVLRAPEDAIVTGHDLSRGQIVGAAQPVISLAATEGLEAVFHSPDHPILDGAMGVEVRLVPIDVETDEMQGVVTEIAPLVDPETGTVTIRVEVSDRPEMGDLLGAAVRGYLEVETDSGVVVPATALTRQGDQPAVWVVDDQNRVNLTQVEIRHFSRREVYLSGGIEPGQIVVGEGSQLLYPGRTVQPAAGEVVQ